MCCPPDLKKWQEPCCGLNESLSDPPQGVLGRFISRDPIGHAGGLNLYAYPVNPVKYTDAIGLKPHGLSDRPSNLNPRLENTTPARFSDALGLIRRSGYGWEAEMLQLMDEQGLVRIDPSIPPLAVADADTGISLHPTFVSSCIPGSGKPNELERLREALELATVLFHEFYHFKRKRTQGTILPDEPTAYNREQEFLYGLYQTENPGCDRANLIKEYARSRWHAGHQMAIGSDYAGLSTPDTYYPTTNFNF